MNFRMIGQVVGRVLCIEAALMLLPMIAAVIYDESPVPFLITIGITGGIGLVMWRVRAKSGGITARDGFLIVGLSWIAMSLLGAIPFVLTGDIPNYIDALFETISGLTTTGASVVTSPESMTRGGMFWRLFTHWIGGMGILVFVLAVLPMSGNRSMHIMRAEVPGPTVGKLVPRIRKTASILYLLYIALTLVETVLLIAGGMSFYDALLHSFATAGTGGLSTRALSIGYYNSAYIDIVVGVFMILFGANFSLYYLILLGNIRTALRNEELRWFLGIIAFAVLTIAVDIRNLYGGVGHALRYSFFQVTSIISTTGFATADFNLWPEYSKFLLVLLMCYEAFSKLDGFTMRELFVSLACGLGYLLLAGKLVEDDAFTQGTFVLSACLLAAYALLLYAWKKGKEKQPADSLPYQRAIAIAVLALVTFESTYNMALTSVSTTSRSSYLESIPAYRELVARNEEKDSDFYRYEKLSRVTKNDGALAGYPTASLFSSTSNAAVQDWYDRMGMSESKVFYCFDGQTPLSAALLNVRYLFSRSDAEDSSLYTLIDEQDGVYLYKNNKTLPAGFILQDGQNLSSSEFSEETSDPFEVQNQMAASVSTSDPLFVSIESEESGNQVFFDVYTEGHYYAYCKSSKIDTVSISSASVNKTYKKVKYDYILDLGRHEIGDHVTLTNDEDSVLNAVVVRLDEAVLSRTLQTLSEQPFTVDSYDSSHVTGHVDVTKAGRLILSIANEPGWTMKVDGEAADYDVYDGVFLSVPLTEGSHTIELSYRPAGLTTGLIVSLICLLVFIGIGVAQKRLGKKS